MRREGIESNGQRQGYLARDSPIRSPIVGNPAARPNLMFGSACRRPHRPVAAQPRRPPNKSTPSNGCGYGRVKNLSLAANKQPLQAHVDQQADPVPRFDLPARNSNAACDPALA